MHKAKLAAVTGVFNMRGLNVHVKEIDAEYVLTVSSQQEGECVVQGLRRSFNTLDCLDVVVNPTNFDTLKQHGKSPIAHGVSASLCHATDHVFVTISRDTIERYPEALLERA